VVLDLDPVPKGLQGLEVEVGWVVKAPKLEVRRQAKL